MDHPRENTLGLPYVGLENPGIADPIIVLVQLFYMIARFRKAVLALQLVGQKRFSALAALQDIFRRLDAKRAPSVDCADLLARLGALDPPLPIVTHAIEIDSQGTSDPRLVPRFFFGRLIIRLDGLAGCGHRQEKAEDFFDVRLMGLFACRSHRT